MSEGKEQRSDPLYTPFPDLTGWRSLAVNRKVGATSSSIYATYQGKTVTLNSLKRVADRVTASEPEDLIIAAWIIVLVSLTTRAYMRLLKISAHLFLYTHWTRFTSCRSKMTLIYMSIYTHPSSTYISLSLVKRKANTPLPRFLAISKRPKQDSGRRRRSNGHFWQTMPSRLTCQDQSPRWGSRWLLPQPPNCSSQQLCQMEETNLSICLFKLPP